MRNRNHEESVGKVKEIEEVLTIIGSEEESGYARIKGIEMSEIVDWSIIE